MGLAPAIKFGSWNKVWTKVDALSETINNLQLVSFACLQVTHTSNLCSTCVVFDDEVHTAKRNTGVVVDNKRNHNKISLVYFCCWSVYPSFSTSPSFADASLYDYSPLIYIWLILVCDTLEKVLYILNVCVFYNRFGLARGTRFRFVS